MLTVGSPLCFTTKTPCGTAETRHLDRRGQFGEFEQEINTGSEQESNKDLRSAQGKGRRLNNPPGVGTAEQRALDKQTLP